MGPADHGFEHCNPERGVARTRNPRARARLKEYRRWLLVGRVEREGLTVAATGVSLKTVYRWIRRWESGRGKELCYRSSRPWRSPRRPPARAETRIGWVRQERKPDLHQLAVVTGHPPSTCYAVLRRWGLAGLDFLES